MSAIDADMEDESTELLRQIEAPERRLDEVAVLLLGTGRSSSRAVARLRAVRRRTRILMRTLIEDISPQGPIVAFDLVVETIWAGVMSTLRAAPLCSAEWLVIELQSLFGYMERLATMVGSGGRGVVLHQLCDMRVLAEAMFPVETVSAWSSGEPSTMEEWRARIEFAEGHGA